MPRGFTAPFQIVPVETGPRRLNFSLLGSLSGNNIRQLEDFLAGSLTPGIMQVVVTIAGLKSISSEGIGLFLRIDRQMKTRHGLLSLLAPPLGVLRMFRASRADQVLAIRPLSRDGPP